MGGDVHTCCRDEAALSCKGNECNGRELSVKKPNN